MRDFYNPFRDYNPLEDMARATSERISNMLNEAATRPLRDMQQALSDGMAARLAVMRPELSLPLMNASALNLETMRAINGLSQTYVDLNPISKAIKETYSITQASIPNVFEDFGERWVKQMNSLMAGSVSGLISRIEGIENARLHLLDHSAAFNAAIGNAIPNVDIILPQFLNDFITGVLHKPLADLDEEDFDTVLDSVGEFVESSLQESGRSTVALQFWFNVLLSLLLFFISIKLGNNATDELKRDNAESRDNVKKHITDSMNQNTTEVTEKVLSIIKSAIPDTSSEIVYVVQRPAKLRVKPTNKSAAMASLYPNQLVSLCKNPGKWIYVEFYDFNEGAPRSGWVYKKYLKRVDRLGK